MSCLETNGQDIIEIDDDFSHDVAITVIMENDAMDLGDAHDDCHPYLDTVADTDDIANVTTCGRS